MPPTAEGRGAMAGSLLVVACPPLLRVCLLLLLSWTLPLGSVVMAKDARPGASPAEAATALNNRGVTAARAGQFEEAVSWLRQALAANPTDDTTRKNLAGVLSDWAGQLDRQGRADQATAALREAISDDPTNGLAFVRLGDLLYLRHGDFSSAIQAWRNAHGKVSASYWDAVANRIAMASRDQLIERDFASQESAHFTIRFPHPSDADAARLERLLEDAYDRLAHQLGEGPTKLPVIVYTAQDLHRVYNQRDWALGLYDGRIRLSLNELTQPYLPDMVAHELAHAFLHQLYGSHLPTWVHEGYAQTQERARPQSVDMAQIEQGIATRTLWIPLKWLDRHFEQPSGTEDIARSYVQARVVVEELLKHHGMDRFKIFLAKLSQGQAVEQSYEAAFAPARWSRADVGHLE